MEVDRAAALEPFSQVKAMAPGEKWPKPLLAYVPAKKTISDPALS